VEEYINRVRKLGPNDVVNGETFNTVIQQLQHNVDLLYRSQASSVQNWNISEILFGNMMDYDQIGQKRFVNGGKLDALEKVLPFNAEVGTVTFEENEVLNNDYWLRWDVPASIRDNVRLVRNIAVPEALRHQNILLAFKLAVFEGNTIKTNERYEIYVNGVYAGTGETGTTVINGIEQAKTIYGTYNLTGTETNLEISLVRSITNGDTPLNYNVRVQNVFVGLHTLGNDSFSMNFPVSGSSFVGAGADINAFYDFGNNSIRPIPSFLINDAHLEGTGSLTVNITAQSNISQEEYYIGISGTGNNLGTSSEDVMPVEDFYDIETFPLSVINVNLQKSDSYDTFDFDKGNYIVHIDDDIDEIVIDTVNVCNSSSVEFVVAPHALDTTINIKNLNVKDKSRFEVHPSGSQRLRFLNENIVVSDSSYLEIEAGVFSQPIISGGNNYIHNGGKALIKLPDVGMQNTDGEYAFGCSLGSCVLDHYAFLTINTDNSNLRIHFGQGEEDIPINLDNHSHVSIKGFTQVTTSALEKIFRGRLHSSIEIFDDIQSDGGATAFDEINMELFSTFGSPVETDTFVEDLIESFVYQIE
jgi:hypothetical protein